MAHVNMHQYTSDTSPSRVMMEALKQKKELDNRTKIARMQSGVELQKAQMSKDYALEQTKLHERNQYIIALKRMGYDMQLKQMGIDMDLELQKLRNFNVMEKAEFDRKTALMVEELKNKNTQAQILKTYQKELRIANGNAKAALYQTFIKTFGDLLKTGAPWENAIDSVLYTAWIAAFMPLYNALHLDRPIDTNLKDLDLGQNFESETTIGGSNENKSDDFDKAVEEALKLLKAHTGTPSKVTPNAKPGWKTKIRMWENERAGKREKR